MKTATTTIVVDLLISVIVGGYFFWLTTVDADQKHVATMSTLEDLQKKLEEIQNEPESNPMEIQELKNSINELKIQNEPESNDFPLCKEFEELQNGVCTSNSISIENIPEPSLKNYLIPHQYFESKISRDPNMHKSQSSWGTDMKIDADNNIYVADASYNGIKKFNKNGNWASVTWGGENTSYLKTKGSGWGQLDNPYGVAVDSNGNVYVVDTNNHRIHKFQSDGKPIDVWGKQGFKQNEFEFPAGIAIDDDDRIFVADTGNNRIQIFDQFGVYLDQIGEEGSEIIFLHAPTKIVFIRIPFTL